MNKIKIIYVVADGFSEYNSSHFRCTLFFDQLAKSDLFDVKLVMIDDWLSNSPKCKSICIDADIIVLQRVLISESLTTALAYKKNGTKVYVDFDDAYQLIGEENAAFPFWGEGKVNVSSPIPKQKLDMRVENPVAQFAKALQKIDGGITPSSLLSSDWAKHNTMYVLQNYLDWNRYEDAFNLYKYEQGVLPLVGWGGSMSHLTSFALSGVIDALQKMTKNQVGKFLLVGDKRVQPMLGIHENEMLFNPYVMWMDWLKVLMRFDIGLAPLANEYDQRRSRLKVMEYIALGIPFVATRSVVYKDFWDCTSGIFVDQGDINVCIKSNPNAWYKAISDIANNYTSWKKEALINRDKYRPIIDIDHADIEGFFKRLL